jgi:hypothetical protein
MTTVIRLLVITHDFGLKKIDKAIATGGRVQQVKNKNVCTGVVVIK